MLHGWQDATQVLFSSHIGLAFRYVHMTAGGQLGGSCSMSYSKAPEGVWITSLMLYGVGKELLTTTALKWNKFLVRD